ncbi:MAG: glycosyl transferase family 2, partial [bacterium]|nr:glycosyl transferase family 2 [bacterium]
EVYSTEGRNVAALRDTDGSRTAANMIRFTDEAGHTRDWQAQNIHDGATTGARGSWRSAGPPPVAVEDPDSVIDLTGQVDAEGNLVWDAPPGDWVLMEFTSANTGQALAVPSPKSQGLAIDHFSAEASRDHLRYLFELLEQKVGPLDQTALKYVYACSYELRGSTWTPDFAEQFRKRRGYDITPYLPVLAGAQVGGHEVTERFRHDYRKTVGELLVDAFYRINREEANKRGLRFVAEAGGPGLPLHQVPVDALQAQGAVDIPRGEFWKEHNVWVVKETANAAHIYGKKVVQMEAFTSFRHWQDGPADLKGIADRAFIGGANQFVWHTMPHTPPEAGLPGWVYHAGTHFGPHLVWWPMAKPFLDYLSRCSYLLQQGLFVADVCFYYGDGGYKFVPEDIVHPMLGPGYSFDYVNSEVILTRMDVRDGRLVLPDGMSYKLLVLPDDDSIDLDVLRRLKELAGKGATIVGPKPTKASGLAGYPDRDAEVRALTDFISGADPRELLDPPDFET